MSSNSNGNGVYKLRYSSVAIFCYEVNRLQYYGLISLDKEIMYLNFKTRVSIIKWIKSTKPSSFKMHDLVKSAKQVEFMIASRNKSGKSNFTPSSVDGINLRFNFVKTDDMEIKAIAETPSSIICESVNSGENLEVIIDKIHLEWT